MTKPTPFRFKSNIGAQRISVGNISAAAGATYNSRAEMEEVVNQIKGFIAHIENVTPFALYEAMVPIKQRADYYCPVDTGEMINSGYLEITAYGKTPQVEIGYGKGGFPEYTPIVHEDLNASHQSPTRAKWLESALNEMVDEVPERVAESLRIQGNG